MKFLLTISKPKDSSSGNWNPAILKTGWSSSTMKIRQECWAWNTLRHLPKGVKNGLNGHFTGMKIIFGGQNVLISKADHQLIGQCGLLVREVEEAAELEIAYSILPLFRGKGFALEAARKCRDFAFENQLHHRLVSIIIPENDNSKKVALNNGLTFRRNIDYSGKKMDLFQMNREDWENLK